MTILALKIKISDSRMRHRSIIGVGSGLKG